MVTLGMFLNRSPIEYALSRAHYVPFCNVSEVGTIQTPTLAMLLSLAAFIL
jgi:hypothetical protein